MERRLNTKWNTNCSRANMPWGKHAFGEFCKPNSALRYTSTWSNSLRFSGVTSRLHLCKWQKNKGFTSWYCRMAQYIFFCFVWATTFILVKVNKSQNCTKKYLKQEPAHKNRTWKKMSHHPIRAQSSPHLVVGWRHGSIDTSLINLLTQ